MMQCWMNPLLIQDLVLLGVVPMKSAKIDYVVLVEPLLIQDLVLLGVVPMKSVTIVLSMLCWMNPF